MTTPAFAATSVPSYRFAGRAAITSGAIGLMAHGFLWAFLVRRFSGGGDRAVLIIGAAYAAGALLLLIQEVAIWNTLGGGVIVGLVSLLALLFFSAGVMDNKSQVAGA